MNRLIFFLHKRLAPLFPNRCPFCTKVIYREQTICDSCAIRVPQYTVRRFAAGGAPCAAALPYKDEYAEAVKRFKFKRYAFYAPAFVEVMTEAAVRVYSPDAYDCVCCVPMHPKDLKDRGFNQSELLARGFAERLGLTYVEAIEKIKRNKKQHTLKRSERAGNVRGVYRVIDKNAIKNKRILLIDDIITTGNTLGECASVLKRHGCRSVSCAVLCTTLV